MHYPPTAFSVNNQPTILAKNGASIGQRTGLSAGDIAGVKLMYPDLAWPTTGSGAKASKDSRTVAPDSRDDPGADARPL
jgi:hypothetical protein